MYTHPYINNVSLVHGHETQTSLAHKLKQNTLLSSTTELNNIIIYLITACYLQNFILTTVHTAGQCYSAKSLLPQARTLTDLHETHCYH